MSHKRHLLTAPGTRPAPGTDSAPRNHMPRGFTLIELLVVIAIISLLAAILFPVFARAREQARKTSCQSNLKQIGLGWHQYTQDFDEMAIPHRTGGVNTPIFNWPQLLNPYLKNAQVFACPSNTSGRGQSYTYSLRIAGFGTPTALASIPKVALVPVFADAYGSNTANQALWFNYATGSGQMYGRRHNGATVPTHQDSRDGLIRANRHTGGAIYAYADGHVKFRQGVGGPPPSCSYPSSIAPPASDLFPPYTGHDFDVDGALSNTTYD